MGKAIDIRLPGYHARRLRKQCIALKSGGVGYYPKSDFVHIDTGPGPHLVVANPASTAIDQSAENRLFILYYGSARSANTNWKPVTHNSKLYLHVQLISRDG